MTGVCPQSVDDRTTPQHYRQLSLERHGAQRYDPGMIDTALRRALLVARHHLGRSAATVDEAIRDLVVLHSSDPLTPHLALWARVPGYQPEDLDTALVDTRSAWRLHAMRRTLWIAPSADVPMLDAAVGGDVARKERKRLMGWTEATRPDAEAWLATLGRAATDAIAERPGITTRELSVEVPELTTKIVVGGGSRTAEAAVGSRLLYVLAMELRIVRTRSSGTWRSSQYGWAPATPTKPMDPALGRARLAARYVARFGPVTTTDVRWWTGSTVARTKAALADAEAVPVELETGPAWVSPHTDLALDTLPVDRPTVSFLPGLDPSPMGYKERDWFLGEHEQALFDRNGNIGPTIWVDGRIVGGWAVRADAGVAVRLLEDVGAQAEARVAAEAAALTAWLDGMPITPRFRTPLERELTA